MAMPPSVMLLIVKPARLNAENGRDQRERNRHQRNDPGAEVREEQKHDQHDQQAAIPQGQEQIANGGLDEIGLTKQPLVNSHPRREAGLNVIECGVQRTSQFDRVLARLLLDAEDHRRLAVVRSLAALQGFAHGDSGHIAHQHRTIAPQRNDGLREIIDAAHAPDTLNEVLLPASDAEAGAGVLAAGGEGFLDLGQGDGVMRRCGGIDDHLILLFAAAGDNDLRHTRYGEQTPTNDGVGNRAQLDGIVACRTRAR